MSAKGLAEAVGKRFEGMGKQERIAKIRKLAGASPEDARFIRETFPKLYREAFVKSVRGAGGRLAAAGGVREAQRRASG